MPKKKDPDDPKAQSERFKKAVQDLVDAGELNPTEADEAFEALLRGSAGRARQDPE
jgi:polyhydroxyalkanoate synthesis regulator phasin